MSVDVTLTVTADKWNRLWTTLKERERDPLDSYPLPFVSTEDDEERRATVALRMKVWRKEH